MDVQAASFALQAQYASFSYSDDTTGTSITASLASISVDTVSFGANPLSTGESLGVILERALAKLQEVVANAQAELGIEPGTSIDTSAEATANRIADFALGFFDQFLENNPELDENEARQAFIDLVGGAVQQGVDEALAILESLQSLTPEVGDKVDSILDLVNQRFEAFLNGDD